MRLFTILLCALLYPAATIEAQPDCITSYGVVYGTPDGNELGHTLAATPDNTGFYLGSIQVVACQSDCSYTVDHVLGDPLVDEQGHCLAGSVFSPAVFIAGTRGNNTILVKMDYTGQSIWSREFDMVPGGVEVPGGLIEDSEGMLVVAGTGNNITQGGTLYAFRYDPDANLILWSQEYTVTPNEQCFGLIEKGPGGNYLLNNSVNRLDLNHNYAGVFEIDRATGTPVLNFAKNYQIIGTETLFELAWHNGALYGVGRYKDGGINQKMRNTLTQLDPGNGDQLWVKMGHRAVNQDARLYGTDIVIAEESIFSIYSGDPVGVSLVNTKLYVQRTELNGDLVWLKQYELPGNADNTIDLLATNDGLIVLAFDVITDQYYFFKVDFNGDMIWAKTFVFNGIQSAIDPVFGNRQLIEAGNKLFFVGYGINTTSDKDMIIVITDAEGTISNGCIESVPVNIQVNEVADVTWYDKQVIQFDVTPDHTLRPVTPIELNLTSSLACMESDTLHSEIVVAICQGQSYENYSDPGIYQDTFLTALGCDSIRILDLSVEWLSIDTILHICNGDDFEGYTQTGSYVDTLQGQNGFCDTIRHLTLFVQPPLLTGINAVICEGGTFLGYDIAGMYIDTFQTSAGCDSVRILNLTVSIILYSSDTVLICLGEAYEGYTTAGIYRDTFQTVAGCDSVREFNLMVEILQKQMDVQICSGQSFEQYSQTGIYVDTIPGLPGMCDTLRELNLTVDPLIYAKVNQTICAGDVYAGYYEPGIYFDTLVTPSGCDSVRELHLETIDAVTSIIQASACDPNSTYNLPPGNYRDTLISTLGCDSIRTLQLEGATVFIPNIFSPNDDGINDVFTLTSFPIIDLELEYFAIFDRFGDMVFETSSWPVVWKGDDARGEPFQPGVFAYSFIYRCGNQRHEKNGDITLVK